MKNITLILICLTICAGSSYSQTAIKEIDSKKKVDSIRIASLDKAAIVYPLLRQGALSTEIIGNANTTANLFGNPLYKGKVSLIREKANFNVPFVQWGQNYLAGSFSYINQHYNISQVQGYNPQFPVKNMKFNTATIGFSLTYSRHDSLFNVPVNYTGTISSFTDHLSSIEKVSYFGAVVFPLKQTTNSAFKVGLAVIIDPASFFPILPVFSYWHKYEGSNMELFVDLPQRIALRKQLTPDSWVIFSTELASNFSFFSLNRPPLPQDAGYTMVELKTGPSYEYRVAKKVILGVNGGLFSTVDSRLSKRNADWNNYYIRNHTGGAPYLNFTISFLPFLRPIK